MKLWSGRLSGSMDETFALLNNSLPFDKRLAQVDVRGSVAWAHALGRAGVLKQEDVDKIVTGLEAIVEEFNRAQFVFQESDEDIHTAVERRLTEMIGPVGGMLHTGRSRNDQVATDFCMWVREAVFRLEQNLTGLQSALLERAEQDMGVILPGYTHFQQAQPILFSHWWLSHFWELQRDQQRLQSVLQQVSELPLGSGALAGTGFPIDRFALAEELGFAGPCSNSLDGVGNRDFAAEMLFWAALTGVHLSKLAEALILYSTNEFGFITLADEFSTGSSLMPQKKNPDPLELIRAKSSVLAGRLTGLLGTLKALPSAYDKDLQEDKPPVFEAVDTMELILPVMSGLLLTLTVNGARSRAAVNWQILATDLADYLVQRGVPFRQAHSATGQAVRRATELGLSLPELLLAEWQAIHPMFAEDLYEVFNVERSLEKRSAWGGTAPQAVKEQLELAKKNLGQQQV
ncbi:MAG TPA: argininosuccinate lyase [Anaerolineaceae bacterium]|nr:argininosuccinate lyase [Anaerolineaceae bacterium]